MLLCVPTYNSLAKMDELQTYLQESGHNTDVSIPQELVDNCTHLTKTSLASPRWNISYRDQRPRNSVHIACRNDTETVGHLEHFNPRHHFILHFLIDVPLWNYKNKLKPLFTGLRDLLSLSV